MYSYRLRIENWPNICLFVCQYVWQKLSLFVRLVVKKLSKRIKKIEDLSILFQEIDTQVIFVHLFEAGLSVWKLCLDPNADLLLS